MTGADAAAVTIADMTSWCQMGLSLVYQTNAVL